MALVHENLYRSKNLAEINLVEYLEQMMNTLVANMTYEDAIKVSTRYCQAAISFEQANRSD